MSNSICKAFVRRNLSVIRSISAIYNPCFLQLTPFSSAAKPTSEIAIGDSFAVNYLVSTFGFSPEKALSASKYLNLKSTEKPDLVLAFLKKNGFTEKQIGRLVRKYPLNVLRDPQKILLPKIEYFQSLGISETEVRSVLVRSPAIFCRSLEKQIVPCFNYVKNLFDANGVSLDYLKGATTVILLCSFKTQLLPNVDILKEAGVPDLKIVHVLRYSPRVFLTDPESLRKTVKDVKEMGFDPLTLSFVVAVVQLRLLSKSTWEKKVAAFKKWGFLENEIISVFMKQPQCMSHSVDKITAFMDFFVNKMGFNTSLVLKAPALIGYSLDTRIKPRASIYKILLDNGLIKKGTHTSTIFQCTEKHFLKNYVHCYEEKAPGLLELYWKELAVGKSKNLQNDRKCKSMTA